MPATTKEIANYSVSIYSNAEPGHMSAAVLLFDKTGKRVAFLRFYPPDATSPANELRPDLGYALVSYPQSALSAVVEILRNEKPLYFIWHDDVPGRCHGAVGTSREPVGEGHEP
jgi:hypothetical protein